MSTTMIPCLPLQDAEEKFLEASDRYCAAVRSRIFINEVIAFRELKETHRLLEIAREEVEKQRRQARQELIQLKNRAAAAARWSD